MNVTNTYEKYLLYAEIEEILKGYQEKYPGLFRLTSYGKTPECRELWVASVTDTSTGDFDDKPAYVADANIHAGEVTGSMVVMHLIDALLTNKDDPEIAKLLKQVTFYVIPRISPDGSDYYLTTPGTLRSAPRMYPYSELQPGVTAEDMDGDGVIRLMRIKTPNGIWKKSDLDPRLMTKRRPDDQEGEFYNVFSEGYVHEYDGLITKVAPMKYMNDFNRNFPYDWAPHFKQRGAGDYALSNPETAALAAFINDHPNICCAVCMHTSGGQYLWPSCSQDPKVAAFPSDIKMYKDMGEIAKEETGYVVVNVHNEYLPPEYANTYGSYTDFLHHAFGILTFAIECWDLNRRAGNEEKYPPDINKPISIAEKEAANVMKWLDENVGPNTFMPWTPFEHPQLGTVEIGGYNTKEVIQNCPSNFLLQECQKHTRFMIREAKILPRLNIEKLNVTNVAENIYKVEAVVMNRGYMPTYGTRETIRLRRDKAVNVTISGAEEILKGKATEDIGHLEGFSSISAGAGSSGYSTGLGEPTEKKVEWIVKAAPGTKLSITASAVRAGRATAEINV